MMTTSKQEAPTSQPFSSVTLKQAREEERARTGEPRTFISALAALRRTHAAEDELIVDNARLRALLDAARDLDGNIAAYANGAAAERSRLAAALNVRGKALVEAEGYGGAALIEAADDIRDGRL
jgi:hypothetical protein